MPASITPTRLLRIRTVLDRVPVCRTQWYAMIKNGSAPAPVALGARAVAWRESDIDAFIANLSGAAK